jgi:hypothetical protein
MGTRLWNLKKTMRPEQSYAVEATSGLSGGSPFSVMLPDISVSHADDALRSLLDWGNARERGHWKNSLSCSYHEQNTLMQIPLGT